MSNVPSPVADAKTEITIRRFHGSWKKLPRYVSETDALLSLIVIAVHRPFCITDAIVANRGTLPRVDGGSTCSCRKETSGHLCQTAFEDVSHTGIEIGDSSSIALDFLRLGTGYYSRFRYLKIISIERARVGFEGIGRSCFKIAEALSI